MESSYSELYKCKICKGVVKFANTTDKIWTGIYVCKGDKHGDMFYCGTGKCVLDKNKRVKTCEDSTCSGFGKEFTLDKKKIHFNRLENELVKCIICSKFIKFTEYHDHVDNCEEDEVVEDEEVVEDNNENNKEEDKDMNENNESSLIEIFKPENLERIDKYKCRFCDQFARAPFYICTSSECLKEGVIYCYECYENYSCLNKFHNGECMEDHKINYGK